MSKFTSIIPMLLLALSTMGCMHTEPGTRIEIDDTNPKKQTKVKTDPPQKQSLLELTYVSGHLGSASGCPNKDTTSGASPAAAEAADMAMGACFDDDGDDCGGFPMNCDDATVTLLVRNTGQAIAEELTITDLELLDANGNPVSIQNVVEITRTDDIPYANSLEVGEEMTIKVNFNAPSPDKVGWNFSAPLRVIMATKDDATAEVITPELHTLPEVAT